MIETAEMLNQEQGITAPGTILALRRKELGWSEREVADKLCLLPKQVIALEDNDFESFSAEIFVKGYLRSYAKLVSLDEDGLLSLYDERYKRPSVQAAPQPNNLTNLPAQQPASRRYLGVVAAVLVVAMLWLFSRTEETGLSTAAEVMPSVTSPASVADDREIDTQLEPAIDVPVVAPVDNHQTLNFSEEEQLLANASAEVIDNEGTALSLGVTIEEPAEVDDTAVDSGVLEIEFSGNCWVEVRDANGSVLVADIKRAGDLLNLSGLPPFRVVLGDATVVKVSYSGEPVNVNPSAENQSARITIGS